MAGGAFTFGVSTPGGTSMDIGFGEVPQRAPVAGEPGLGVPTRTLFIIGGLAVAAVALIVLLK